ncbi:transcriptional regulator [Staphylococcus saprophyticus]|uniref:transcriptional regulator n=1 Tax=Staphylococcus saprophyticus TaxID=29385 RepID=UPI000853E984|nr:transcriptional regulator [Staphylococcus saprophyticus]OEK18810.1 transcriptional regulator [Staphylococcus saprophyticus]QKQ32219.1 transcriptional regulator [Staphylococcus saprophyticus]
MSKTGYDIKPGTFKYVESEIYNLNKTKQDIKKLRMEILNPMSTQDDNVVYGPLQKGEPTRTTEVMATKLMTNKVLRNSEEMVQAIEYVYSNMEPTYKEVIRKKYWDNSTKHMKLEILGDECNMHRNTVSNIRKKFVRAVALHVGLK